jgi:hypothetical protein
MKTKIGYKLFEMDTSGNLYPLFIGKNEITPINQWVMAQIIIEHKGFAHRPGWHIGATMPSAPWLMGADGTYKSQRGKSFQRVWCEVEYVANVDYTNVVEKLPKKCFIDRLPDDGFYKFRESGNRLWIIADRIKVNRILSEEERRNILNEIGYDETEAFAPYRSSFEKRMKNAV